MIAQVTAHTHEATHTHKPHALKLAAQGGGSKCASSRRSSRALPPVAASTVKLHIPAEHFHFKVRLCGATAKYIQRKGARESSIGCSRRRRKTDTRPGRARGELPPRPASGACAFTVKFSHTQGTSARVFVTNFFDKNIWKHVTSRRSRETCVRHPGRQGTPPRDASCKSTAARGPRSSAQRAAASQP